MAFGGPFLLFDSSTPGPFSAPALPSGTVGVWIETWGPGGWGGKGGGGAGGGGGGGGNGQHNAGAKAGGTVISGVIGAPGANDGHAGTDTTITSPALTAHAGGNGDRLGVEGLGGSSIGSTVNFTGQNGGAINVWDGGASNDGGLVQSTAGAAGNAPGGGGAGASGGGGGQGANGRVRITYALGDAMFVAFKEAPLATKINQGACLIQVWGPPLAIAVTPTQIGFLQELSRAPVGSKANPYGAGETLLYVPPPPAMTPTQLGFWQDLSRVPVGTKPVIEPAGWMNPQVIPFNYGITTNLWYSPLSTPPVRTVQPWEAVYGIMPLPPMPPPPQGKQYRIVPFAVVNAKTPPRVT